MLSGGGLVSDSIVALCPWRGLLMYDLFRSPRLIASSKFWTLGKRDAEIILLTGSGGSVMLRCCGFSREAGGKGVFMLMFWKESSGMPCMF